MSEPSQISKDYGGDQLYDQDYYFVSYLQRNGLSIQLRLAAIVVGVKPKLTKMIKWWMRLKETLTLILIL